MRVTREFSEIGPSHEPFQTRNNVSGIEISGRDSIGRNGPHGCTEPMPEFNFI